MHKEINMNFLAQAMNLEMVGQPLERSISRTSQRLFLIWTLFWWGGVGVCAILFHAEVLGFLSSTKIALYGISIWLNGWLLALVRQKNEGRSRLSVWHDCLVIWMLSYAMTNILWEIPWVIFSWSVFTDLNTIDDVLVKTDYMRESFLHMYWWVLGSFSSVDLRTVNHNSTFYTIEVYAFLNVLSTAYFFYLNKKRSLFRYLVPVLTCSAPAATTFIFSFSEVFGDFENMPGGVADTLLALVWTQYQYLIFPLIFGYVGFRLFLDDWRRCYLKS